MVLNRKEVGSIPNLIEIPQIQSTTNKELLVEVVFGTPKRDCQGYGICKVIAFCQFNPPNCNCKHAPALVRLINQERLEFRFEEENLEMEIIKRFFSKPYFLVYQDFLFPDWMIPFFKREKVRIDSGKYPIIINNGTFIIAFSLSY